MYKHTYPRPPTQLSQLDMIDFRVAAVVTSFRTKVSQTKTMDQPFYSLSAEGVLMVPLTSNTQP